MARLNRPSIFIYGGSIKPSKENTDYVTVSEKVGEFSKGTIDEEELIHFEEISVEGPGSCGGMYTANTMASAIEALGMSLPGSSSQDAVSSSKNQDCIDAGTAIMHLLEKDIKPSDIMTKEAFENAITIVIALGGSTNAVLHLLAMAHSIGVKLSLDDFTEIGKRTPVLADLKPFGSHYMSELNASGGIQPLMKTLLEKELLKGDCITVTGNTLRENLVDIPSYPNNEIIKENGIKWGPFRLRIPFVHMKFLTGEFLQGLIIAGATALAGAPVVMALGLSFEQAVACALIASILITSGPIIFGEPLAPGWVTPALPLVIAFLNIAISSSSNSGNLP